VVRVMEPQAAAAGWPFPWFRRFVKQWTQTDFAFG
jgi:hypothetical protein